VIHDRVVVRGTVRTMDPRQPIAESFAVSCGRIVAVGELEDVRAALPEARPVDFGCHTIIPGFVDAHCHMELTTTHLKYAVKCFAPPHRSLAEIGATLADYARANPGDGWIVGRADFGLHQFVEERRPLTRADLDEAVPDRPVVVYSGGHVCTLNTAGLRAAGLLDGAPPPMGSTVDLDSGRGLELRNWLPRPGFGVEATADAIAELGREMFVSRGVTSITDIVASTEGVRAYQVLAREERLPFRVDLRYHSAPPGTPSVATASDVSALGLESGFGSEWLRIGGMKLYVDGAGHDLVGQTVVDLKWRQDDLDDEVQLAHEAGLQVMCHVQSIEAIEMALHALERGLLATPRPDHRHRLEHAGDMVLSHEVLRRIRDLGVVIVATPQFLYSYADTKLDVNQPPLRTLHAWGFRVPGNSDSTGSQPEAANPFHGIWCAMTRRTRLGTEITPSERIGLDAALRMFTADAAYASHLDDRGVLAPGKLADFVVLGRDPYAMDIDDLPETPVEAVWIGGRPIYERGSIQVISSRDVSDVGTR
jgi:predicted amidohydrolase YtcJ